MPNIEMEQNNFFITGGMSHAKTEDLNLEELVENIKMDARNNT